MRCAMSCSRGTDLLKFGFLRREWSRGEREKEFKRSSLCFEVFRRKVKAILAIVIISWYFYKHFLPLFDHLHVKIVRKPLWVNFMHNLITFIWRQRETRRIPCHFQHFWHQKPPAQRITSTTTTLSQWWWPQNSRTILVLRKLIRKTNVRNFKKSHQSHLEKTKTKKKKKMVSKKKWRQPTWNFI